ncbi:MAG: acetate--CoA ligase family protein [Deltaproteobacteria bacterium]|nr:acetate--CoA ligase family protein [Deltaproteobacteria bacterium]
MPVLDKNSHLQALFAPQSVAVIGASSRPESVGRAVFSNVLRYDYTGVVYPVNPKARSIMGVRAYTSVLDIPDPVDLAVIIVPSAGVAQVLQECGQKGIKGAIVITAGFKELGGEGINKEAEVLNAARQSGIPLLGPNCLGIINTDPQVSLNASFSRLMPSPGNIALVSQSGAVGVAALEYAQAERIGLSKFVSVGNKADLNENDFLAYLQEDPQTDVILLYLEDLADPRRFFQLAEGSSPRKPILAIKSGRTAAGAKAASSHTGALAGSDAAYDALFAQCGVFRVESLEELFDYAAAFATQPLPQGNRAAIVTNAGGLGIMATDAAVRYGLTMANFQEETMERLQESLPPAANLHNPVDVLGDATEERYAAALENVLADPGVDGAIVISTPQLMTNLAAIASAVTRVASQHQKPTLVCQMALGEIEETLTILSHGRLPHYAFPEEAVRTLGAMARYARNLGRPRYEVKTFADVDRDAVTEVFAGVKNKGRSFVLEPEAHQIFQAYGFPVLPHSWVRSADDAAQAAEEMGYPVALKIVSPDIVHSRAQAELARAEAEVGRARCELTRVEALVKQKVSSEHALDQTRAALAVALVQKMAAPGAEMILGMTRDPHFGPLLMIGLGGTLVEIFQDVMFSVAPISEPWAHRMIEDLKAFPLLSGYRGEPPGDLEMIAECLERLSQLALDFPEIRELDINPLMVFPQGQGAAVVDARIFVG